ncbi:hypothetical protein Tco_0844369 [Tanacetum coccineum]
MADLTFADFHNMVAYLEKSKDNADFVEIVDFLNASPIRYALTVSPTVYVSYIEQFWSTAKIKTINNETQIRAKVDGKTIVITKSSVRRDLHFDDEDGITCLTNTKIFENHQLMGYEKLSDKLTFLKPFFSPQWKYLVHTILQCLSSKSTAWNEFGTNIASAVICLAKNKKINFSKLIFDAVFNDKYDTPSHTKKVFANMRKQRKDFSGTVTPLFPSMLALQAVEGEDEAVYEERGGSVEWAATTTTSLDAKQRSGNINRTQSMAIPNVPFPQGISSGGSLRCQKAMGDTIAQTRSERVSTPSYDSPLLGVNTPGSDKERIKLKELMDMCTKLFDTAWNAFSSTIASAIICLATNQKFNFSKYIFDNMMKNLEGGVKFLMYPREKVFPGKVTPLFQTMMVQAPEDMAKDCSKHIMLLKKESRLEKIRKSRTSGLKRLRKVGSARRVESSDDASLGAQEDASKQGRKIADIDQDAEVTLIDETRGRSNDNLMFDTGVLDMAKKEVDMAKKDVSTTDSITTASESVTTASVDVTTASATTTTVDELTLA